ncbi:hypothetical protein ACQ4M4_23120 [Leptolyngbya sp. AN02str]|uniref:hypothetical protein n=1 Tax=Leptolyngbya sp. AN02str TaxID=3423363 RepID=UPI003D3151BC
MMDGLGEQGRCWLWRGVWGGAIALMVCFPVLGSAPAQASDPIRPRVACPTELEDVMALMLRDLPSYGNRIIQRARDRDRSEDISGYILVASQPNFTPLPLPLGEQPASNVRQVFFTTLERQYGISGFAQLQVHHWAFFTPSSTGWQLVLMQSAFQSYPSRIPPAPTRDSSYGVVAQAMRLWLRDCQAGAIRLSLDS